MEKLNQRKKLVLKDEPENYYRSLNDVPHAVLKNMARD